MFVVGYFKQREISPLVTFHYFNSAYEYAKNLINTLEGVSISIDWSIGETVIVGDYTFFICEVKR